MKQAFKLSLQFLILFVCSHSLFALSQTKPERIVSLSLCTDLLLLLLTDKDNIASLSYLVADPEFSALAEEAKGITLNRAQADEVLLFKPDLILSSQFSATATVNLLKRLDHEVTVLDFPNTLDAAYEQIRQVAALVMEEDKGNTLISNMQKDIRLSLEKVGDSTKGKSAIFLATNGFTHGSNTLRDNFLSQFGLSNVASDNGLSGSGILPLETLLMAEPDFLLVDKKSQHREKLSHSLLEHSAVKQIFHNKKIVTLPDNLFQCAGPSLSKAFAIMTDAINTKTNSIQNLHE